MGRLSVFLIVFILSWAPLRGDIIYFTDNNKSGIYKLGSPHGPLQQVGGYDWKISEVIHDSARNALYYLHDRRYLYEFDLASHENRLVVDTFDYDPNGHVLRSLSIGPDGLLYFFWHNAVVRVDVAHDDIEVLGYVNVDMRFSGPSALYIESVDSAIIVVQGSYYAIFRMNLNDGTYVEMPDAGLYDIYDVLPDGEEHLLLKTRSEIYRYEIQSGDVEVVYEDGNTKPYIQSSGHTMIRETENTVLIPPALGEYLVRVNIQSGAIEIVSQEGVRGNGPAFKQTPFESGLDWIDEKTIVVGVSNLYLVDIPTGNRTYLHGSLGPLTDYSHVRNLFVPEFNGPVYGTVGEFLFQLNTSLDYADIVWQLSSSLGFEGGCLQDHDTVIIGIDNSDKSFVERVDLGSGTRETISSGHPNFPVGEGVLLTGINDVALMPNGDILATIHDPDLHAIVKIDPASGDREVFSDDTHGSGTAFVFPRDIVVRDDGTIAVMDISAKALVEVDAEGNRNVLSDNSTNPENPFVNVVDLDYFSNGDYLVCDTGVGLIRVDKDSGERTVLRSAILGFDAPTSVFIQRVPELSQFWFMH